MSVHQLHIEGEGQLQLGLFKQLRGGSMEIFPSRAVFESARVSWGEHEVMRNGQVRVEASIARH
ncbi:hypothetical protein AZ54_02575 [Xanthomonas oryzae pv. oryzae PXO86]|uniref:Uncharacterized protein n=1 Tax=Xanthomonas oryzae pv. oryzae (strain KACC10331 / KXO85) TaxID=291331 RepID=Q5GUU1_XANOR|nr:conserved hypothetical protein [Xanthomonas oryzae pv. oryzae KACC 10331]AJQ81647.1 hypothetical protein AZ54_02575 [Xanthomonas oryzae pv. oryzae PXO86]QIF23534.1 hypothetical protein G6N84_17170 [Xanthomonas oryzae pv. oryzae]UXV91747.1 hypothetical protein IXO597_020795 [Xanthomonas oryzae pv. oryzae]